MNRPGSFSALKVLLDACVDQRLWNLDTGENFKLVMSGLGACHETAPVTSLAYNSSKGIGWSVTCYVKCSAVCIRIIW